MFNPQIRPEYSANKTASFSAENTSTLHTFSEPLSDGNNHINQEVILGLNRNLKERPSYSVRDNPQQTHNRTISKYGLTQYETYRASNAGYVLKTTKHPIFWAVVGDDILELTEKEARQKIREIQSRLIQAQEREGLPKFYFSIFEASGGFHVNLIFVGSKKIAQRLADNFPNYFKKGFRSGGSIQPVRDMRKLTRKYLAKERTSRAHYAMGFEGTRLRGAHCLEHGGDRVRLSKHLEKYALLNGFIEPWKKTNAKRSA